ncbi:class I SAM-dependent methyltransferase [Spirosoma aureum]|uniref:Class I SAM-dependent methyltransferase n=1 Tax=Spirosoma aureum TaxID=2692134 RepID=A0A6G9AHR9_9BACT|nr:class I SAM-dependent methyltransferase [Spirosoma aureum]QIP12022.1 class I SAM-dependent methyltransferase [Spirosoma aureum]
MFIFTEPPYWLDEAYSSAITKLDIGLIIRNEAMAPIVKSVINKWFDPNGRFIDYGGGYGMLVRMMRDRGFDYYRQDIHCENLYAESFDIVDIPPFKAEVLTAFEVFEHLIDPVAELEKMLALSDTILFSTMVQPHGDVSPDSWWYFTPETGQHIALYSRKSLQALADRFNLNYNWNEQDVHLFSRKKINNSLFKIITHPRWGRWYNTISGERDTFLQKDFLSVQKRLRENLMPPSKTILD